MRPPLDGLDVAVVDIETTGLLPGRHNRIVEVAVVRRRVGEPPARTFATLVDPGRDVGNTNIHGIRAGDLAHAPAFEDIAGDLAQAMQGAVVAGHNVRFDAAFLRSELERARCVVDLGEPLCTLRLASQIGIDTEGRSLAACCSAVGVPQEEHHAALPDALASAELLDAYARVAEERRLKALEDLNVDVAPCRVSSSPPATGRCCPRGTTLPSDSPPYLAQLVSRLAPSVCDHAPDLTGYFELLDRVLEDAVVTTTEAEALAELARLSGLGPDRVQAAHRTYLGALATAALEDRVVTEHERYELDGLARLLGFPAAVVGEILASAADPAAASAAMRQDLRGRTVCFTGEICSALHGAPISRELAEFLAREAGLRPVASVTKKLDILVVADPHTMSTKAKKARHYGTRIMSERAFWRALGIAVS
ncbi:MAG TPA: exonuclease domain-containing protein [Vicinamibacterales bacterium]|nr:exonuclease domain-containing protein [Vicinamibacterales bacterium]